MPMIHTLGDTKSTPLPLVDTNVRCVEGNSIWSLNVGMWVVLQLVVTILRPPVIVMLALNALLFGVNLNSMRLAGRQNTPLWVFVVMGLQALVVLQYTQALLRDLLN